MLIYGKFNLMNRAWNYSMDMTVIGRPQRSTNHEMTVDP